MILKRMNYKGQVLELSQVKSFKHPIGNVEKAVGYVEKELRKRSMLEV